MTTPTTAERLADAELGWGDTLADYIGQHCPTEFPRGADKAAELIMAELVRPLLADLERARRIAVALEQQLALATVLEVPRPATAIPLQLRRSYGHTDRWAICDRTGRRWHREHGWVHEPDGIRDEHLRNDTRFALIEALPLAQQLAEDGGE